LADQPQAQPYQRVDQLYVVIARVNDQAPKLAMPEQELVSQHRAYLKVEHDKGTLVGSGPGQDHDGSRHVGAVMLLRCESLQEATELAHREPYLREGQRLAEIIPWRRVWFDKQDS
jgi:uncharacterized protein YciI